MRNGFKSRPNFGFYNGVSATPDVPDLYPVALAGHPYLLAEIQPDDHYHGSLPDLNPRAYGFSASDQVSERTLNPDAAWRRSQESWHAGAGQRHLDAADSDRTRFWQSKGVDVWTRWQLSLLNATARKRVSLETNLAAVPVGDRLYLADGAEVYHTADLATWTAANINQGEASALRPLSITSDGYRLFAALGANGIHVTNRGTATSASYNDLQATLVGWVKSRLMAALGPDVFYVQTSGAAPTSLFTHPNPDWEWTAFSEGDVAIYVAGFSGDKSEIYRIGIKDDGSGLDQPRTAGRLPDGEVATGLGFYLGYLWVGTTKGVRMCAPLDNGDLRLGPVIETGNPVYGFEGQDRFLWFGWQDFDSTSTGLGRIDATVLNDIAPAYATDLMATDQGPVTSVVTFGGRRVFTVAGSGVWQEADAPVLTGFLDTGLFSYGIADAKTALAVTTRYEQPNEGDHRVGLSDDTGTFADLGSALTGFASAGQRRGEAFELRHTLTSDGESGPVLRTWTLRCLPAPPSTEQLVVPLSISAEDVLPGRQARRRDPAAELAFLKGLRRARNVFTYQEGVVSESVVMADYRWIPRHPTDDGKAAVGIFIAMLTTART